MFDDEIIVAIGQQSYSVSDLMIRLGLKPAGRNHPIYREKCESLGVVFLKRPHKRSCYPQRELEVYLSLNGPNIGSYKLKHKLYASGLKQPKCEKCGIENWLGQPLSFHLEHKDGNNRNNLLNNLEILCPNCHSQTETYAIIKSLKPKRKCTQCQGELWRRSKTGLCKDCVRHRQSTSCKTNSCKHCSKVLSKKGKLQCCRDCYDEHYRIKKIANRPSLEEIKRSVALIGCSATGRKYGVSDNCVRKWINRSSENRI